MKQYADIELGNRIPGASLLATVEREKGGSAWADMASFPFPLFAATKGLAVLTDKEGNVTAKLYHDQGYAHWLLVQTAGIRWRMETIVPETAYRERPNAPASQPQAPPGSILAPVQEALSQLSKGLPDRQRRTLWSQGGSRFSPAEELEMSIPPGRIRADTRKGLNERSRPITLDQLDLTDVDQTKIPVAELQLAAGAENERYFLRITTVKSGQPGTVLEHVMDEQRLLQGLELRQRVQQNMGGALASELFFLNLFFGNATDPSHRLAANADTIKGITSPGFDWTCRWDDGARCRLRNLGGRRVCLEYDLSYLTDGFFIGTILRRPDRDSSRDARTMQAQQSASGQ